MPDDKLLERLRKMERQVSLTETITCSLWGFLGWYAAFPEAQLLLLMVLGNVTAFFVFVARDAFSK